MSVPHVLREYDLGGAGAYVLYGAGALGGAFAEFSWHAAALIVPTAIVCVITAVSLA